MTQVSNQRLRELHADLCGTMANATRLAILECLHSGEKSVTEITDSLQATITTVSQHLRVLRDKHVVVTRKDGQTVFYRLRDPRMIDACRLIRAVLTDGMKEDGDLVRKAAPAIGPGPDQKRVIKRAAVHKGVRREPAQPAIVTLHKQTDALASGCRRQTNGKSK